MQLTESAKRGSSLRVPTIVGFWTRGNVVLRNVGVGRKMARSLAVNAGVIDADYTREIKVILVNLGNKEYEIHKEDKICQLIVERIASEEAILVENQETTERGTKWFGSSDMEITKQFGTSPNLLTKLSTQEKSWLRGNNPRSLPRGAKAKKDISASSHLCGLAY